MPAVLISRGGVSAGTSGTLAASRSAKKIVALRLRLSQTIELDEQLALALHALVERQLDGGLTHLMMFPAP